MSPEEIRRALCDILFRHPKDEQLRRYKALSSALSTSLERDILEALYGMRNEYDLAAKQILLILLHGIRTEAPWQERVRQVLSDDSDITVVPIGYGFFDLFKFIGTKKRHEPISKVAAELRDIRRVHPDKNVVVAAHSFGTYVITELLRTAPDIQFQRLLLCGSVVDLRYRWDSIPAAFTGASVVNEVGTRDIWPVFARVCASGYGPSGAFGFKTLRVTDRYFKYGHSEFFSEDHINTYWRPFVKEGRIEPSPWDGERPAPTWLISFLGGFPGIKIVLALVVLLILAVLAGLTYGLIASVSFLFALF